MNLQKTSDRKLLIAQPRLAELLDLTRSGLEKLRKKDPNFPRPLKDGTSRQAAVFYVRTEIDSWLAAKIAARDAV